jgi:hypothetical protein
MIRQPLWKQINGFEFLNRKVEGGMKKVDRPHLGPPLKGEDLKTFGIHCKKIIVDIKRHHILIDVF